MTEDYEPLNYVMKNGYTLMPKHIRCPSCNMIAPAPVLGVCLNCRDKLVLEGYVKLSDVLALLDNHLPHCSDKYPTCTHREPRVYCENEPICSIKEDVALGGKKK